MPDTQPEYSGGSVPNDWGNVLVRRWTAQLPTPLAGGFLKVLFALRQLSSANGKLRYPDGKGVPMRDIVRASRCDQRDVRTYLTAAIAAGVVGIQGERRRGIATIYILLLNPSPNWPAALAVVSNGRRSTSTKRGDWIEAAAEESTEHTSPASSGHPAPTSAWGHPAPTRAQERSGHPAPTEFGAPCPERLGAPRPHQPCNNHEGHHEEVEVVPQPQDARGRADEHDDPPTEEPATEQPEQPTLRTVPDPPVGSRARRERARQVPEGQRALLVAVPAPHGPTDPHTAAHSLADAEIARLRAEAETDPDAVRRGIARLGQALAVAVYGRRLVFPLLTGT